MNGLTNYITEQPWDEIITAWAPGLTGCFTGCPLLPIIKMGSSYSSRMSYNLTVLAPATVDKPAGAKIRFVATAELIEPPFSGCYWIEPVESDQPSAVSQRLIADG